MPWPIEPLLQRLGSHAALLTAGDYNSDHPPLTQYLGAWTREVEACIEVPLDSDVSEFIALENLRGSLLNREDIEDLVRELPADVRTLVGQWLDDGPDAEFVRLTEPDVDRLLRRADLVSRAPIRPWYARVPRQGLVRVALEHEARACDERAAEEPVPDAALWRSSSWDDGGVIRAVFVQNDLALVIDDEDGDLKRVGPTGYRRTHGGWTYVFSEYAGTGDFTGPDPREASGWNNDIAWAVGRGGPGEAVHVRHHHSVVTVDADDHGWWAYFTLAPDDIPGSDPDVYLPPKRMS